MKEKLEQKIKHTESCLNRAMDRFLSENTRKTRDEVIRLKERVKVYNECLNLNESKK